LENQFGDDAITPIVADPADAEGETQKTTWDGLTKQSNAGFAPGLDISVAPFSARVWLRDLSVECKNAALRMRVQAVVEKASETVAGMGFE
jgi:hypothetical protein